MAAAVVADAVGLEAEVALRKADLHSREMTSRNLREVEANEANEANEASAVNGANGKSAAKSVAGDPPVRGNNASFFTQKPVGQALG